MLQVYIIYSTHDKFYDQVVTLLAESEDQALEMASRETMIDKADLMIREKTSFTDHPQIIDSVTIYYGV